MNYRKFFNHHKNESIKTIIDEINKKQSIDSIVMNCGWNKSIAVQLTLSNGNSPFKIWEKDMEGKYKQKARTEVMAEKMESGFKINVFSREYIDHDTINTAIKEALEKIDEYKRIKIAAIVNKNLYKNAINDMYLLSLKNIYFPLETFNTISLKRNTLILDNGNKIFKTKIDSNVHERQLMTYKNTISESKMLNGDYLNDAELYAFANNYISFNNNI